MRRAKRKTCATLVLKARREKPPSRFSHLESDKRERGGAGRGGAGAGGGLKKLQLLMVGSRRLRDLTNQESDKHAGKPGAFANPPVVLLRRERQGRALRLDHLRLAPLLPAPLGLGLGPRGDALLHGVAHLAGLAGQNLAASGGVGAKAPTSRWEGCAQTVLCMVVLLGAPHGHFSPVASTSIK